MVGIQTPPVATVHNRQSSVGPHWPRAYPAGCSVRTTADIPGQSTRLRPARCADDCGLCEACVRRLPLALVQLMAQSRLARPGLFATAVTCSRMWLRAHPANVAGDAR